MGAGVRAAYDGEVIVSGLVVDVEELRAICARYGVSRLEVFGSASRSEATSGSDIDLLYELAPGSRLGWTSRSSRTSSPICSAGPSTSFHVHRSTSASATRCWQKLARSMRRELLLIGEMIDAAAQAQSLVAGTDLDTLRADRQRRDALLWNFTVLGEAAAQLDDEVKGRFPDIPGRSPLAPQPRHPRLLVDRFGDLHTTATDLLPGFVARYGTLSSPLRPTFLVVIRASAAPRFLSSVTNP